ncbi:YegS/Rv2252/BmrU family lipid kinase [Lagierella sp.]|uniref:diacylglycerol/lipid kinase family protein n=1 Tax=Lagierella sp. TaxID=2849657 RepID=UPI00262299F3|nr:YegS/Rv2252/BmrU family lipid kinase [Lagierella sp.]
MEKVKIIYNPTSGYQLSKKMVQNIALSLLDLEYVVSLSPTKDTNSAYEETVKAHDEGYDIILACGGDGTVNEVVNAMADSKTDMKLGIFPTGTVNDFATYLGLDGSSDNLIRLIKNDFYIPVDIGKANDKYFVNVAAGGKLANIAHETDKGLKSVFGRLAYYAEGVKAFPDAISSGFKLKYELDGEKFEDDALVFLVSNSSSIGGFSKIAPNALVTDGYLDVIIIKDTGNFVDVAQIFFKILSGEHVDDARVSYFHAKSIKIESDQPIDVDVDGESLGELHVNITVADYKLKVFTNIKEW